MTNSILDTPGARIKWARMRQKKTQKALGREVGVKSVYISQLESGRYRGGRGLVVRLAAALDVSRAFLEMDTDDPAPPREAEAAAPCYFAEEADEAARLIDAMPQARREEALALVRVVAAHAHQSEQPKQTPDEEVRPIESVPGAHGGKLILRNLAK